MAFIELICPQCGYQSEELIKSDGKYPNCPACGAPLKQKLSGKCYTQCAGKSGHACSGHCATCGGCK